MKVRNGFVSNSSSSSFIMLIPENFNVDEFDFTPHQNKFDDTDEENVKRTFKKMVDQGYLYADENWKNYYPIREIFTEFVIGQVETGPDEGAIQILNKKEVDKIRKLLS